MTDTPPMRNPPAPRPETMPIAGPMNERALRELRARIEQKRAEALQFLGDRWILHPKNKVK
jgi:hypothetical protein